MKFTIRQETPEDYDEIYELVQKSFACASHSDGTEADYLNALRSIDTFIPDLSFAAEDETGRIIGQIVLYRTIIAAECADITALVLSPVCVHPDHFRKGIARATTEHASVRAAGLGYPAVFLCGEPQIYSKLGFRPSCEFGIFHKDNPQAPWCMGKELIPGALEGVVSGIIDIV